MSPAKSARRFNKVTAGGSDRMLSNEMASTERSASATPACPHMIPTLAFGHPSVARTAGGGAENYNFLAWVV